MTISPGLSGKDPYAVSPSSTTCAASQRRKTSIGVLAGSSVNISTKLSMAEQFPGTKRALTKLPRCTTTLRSGDGLKM